MSRLLLGGSFIQKEIDQAAKLNPQTKGAEKETNKKFWRWLRVNHDVVAQCDSVIKHNQEDQVANKELGLH